MLKWARMKGCPWDEETCNNAAEYRHRDLFRWARNHGCPGTSKYPESDVDESEPSPSSASSSSAASSDDDDSSASNSGSGYSTHNDDGDVNILSSFKNIARENSRLAGAKSASEDEGDDSDDGSRSGRGSGRDKHELPATSCTRILNPRCLS